MVEPANADQFLADTRSRWAEIREKEPDFRKAFETFYDSFGSEAERGLQRTVARKSPMQKLCKMGNSVRIFFLIWQPATRLHD